MDKKQRDLRRAFMAAVEDTKHPKYLCTVIKLQTGALETIVNTSKIEEKLVYICAKYNDEFRLIACTDIVIVAFILL